MYRFVIVSLSMWMAASLMACEGDDAASCENCGSDDPIEVAGTWETSFDTEEVITDASWAYMEVVSFDNGANQAITQNPSDDMYNPDKYNRIVWTEPANGQFHYCMIAFGKDSAEAAANDSAQADTSDLDGEGCGG
ncbi:MAG: hypothetical protein KC417_13175, partial [Myxococcales bacterium]|nr:hypothetical protein [Myxococcales bacterium]